MPTTVPDLEDEFDDYRATRMRPGPTRREPLILRRHNLAASVLCEALADELDSMVALRVVSLTTGQVDAVAAGLARSLEPWHVSVTRTDGYEVHQLTVNAEVHR